MSLPPLTHLQRLEAESIHILREVVAEAERPVMLYSIGKDSAVMLHLAKKAFYPAPPPFPLLHVDTTWKFQAMYELRDKAAKAAGMELLVHRNPDAVAQGIVINGLTILNDEPMLDIYYRQNVIGGPGAFVVATSDYETFAQAILDKLVREIALDQTFSPSIAEISRSASSSVMP